MFASLGRAIVSLFDPGLWGMAAKAVLVTLVLFIAIAVGVEMLVQYLPTLGAPWVNRAIDVLAPLLAIIGLLAAGGPVAALFGSLYLEKVADAIENRSYPGAPKAKPLSFGKALGASTRTAGAVLLVDLLLIPADTMAPPFGEILTIVANAFLLGREYFELAALRHLEREAADALRKRNAGRVFAVGLIVSVLSYVPLADIVAPLFGAIMMVHLYQRTRRESA